MPEGDVPIKPAVRIRQIEHISQFVGSVGIHQKGDALGAAIDPSAQRIPGFDTGTGNGIRLLGVDQNLILKAVFIGICCGVQEFDGIN